MMPSRSIHDRLVTAASSNDVVSMAALIAEGADVHYQEERAIVLAACNGHAAALRLLLDHGADINANNGRPLVRAVSNGFIEAAKVLLSRGADVNIDNGQALISACSWGTAEMVELLLEHGADPHISTELPLLRAISHGNAETLQLLLNAGVDVFVSDAVALLMAQNDDDVFMTAMIEKEMAKQRADFMAQLHAARDVGAFLRGAFVNPAGFMTGDAAIVRALKMGVLADTLKAMREKGVYLTETFLFDAKNKDGKNLITLARQGHDTSALGILFDPVAWGGRTGDMLKSWNRYWDSLWPVEQKVSPLKPEDLDRHIAEWRRRELKTKGFKPPRL